MAKIFSAWNVVVFIFVMLGLYVSIRWVTKNPTVIIFLKVYFTYIIFFSVILFVSIIFNFSDDVSLIKHPAVSDTSVPSNLQVIPKDQQVQLN